MPINRIITVMADFGGAYAWARRSQRERGVGPNIADACAGFPDEYIVPEQLCADFRAWVIWFEKCWDNDDFDWPPFHARGIALAQRLKRVLGPRFVVIYEKPAEDRDYPHEERLLIE